jgi:hypothetical protein
MQRDAQTNKRQKTADTIDATSHTTPHIWVVSMGDVGNAVLRGLFGFIHRRVLIYILFIASIQV